MSRYDAMRAKLFATVFEGPDASLDRATRAAIASDRAVPAALAEFVAKVHRHAYRVTDEEITALLAQGYTEDQLFEAIVVASIGASKRQFDAARAAIGAKR